MLSIQQQKYGISHNSLSSLMYLGLNSSFWSKQRTTYLPSFAVQYLYEINTKSPKIFTDTNELALRYSVKEARPLISWGHICFDHR